MNQQFSIAPSKTARILCPIWNKAVLITPKNKVTACRDRDDDSILECALEARATIIVTGDQDLLTLHPFEQIAILTPSQFLEAHLWTVDME